MQIEVDNLQEAQIVIQAQKHEIELLQQALEDVRNDREIFRFHYDTLYRQFHSFMGDFRLNYHRMVNIVMDDATILAEDGPSPMDDEMTEQLLNRWGVVRNVQTDTIYNSDGTIAVND